MTGRTVKEWVGKTPDSRVPDRVVARLFLAQRGACAVCGRRLGVGGEAFDADHVVALANGGENREGNLRLVCRDTCHRTKTAADVAEKSQVARQRKKHRIGTKRKSRFPNSRDGPWKTSPGGRTVRREEQDRW